MRSLSAAGVAAERRLRDERPAERRRNGAHDGTNGHAMAGLAAKTAALGKTTPKAKEQEVLDVATAYFLEHGYQGASINEMARKSGISKESIYRYFSSKKQLFEAVICRELAEYQQQLRRVDLSLKSMELRAALVAIGETVLGVITTDRTLALRRLLFDEARRSPDVGEHYYHIGPEQAVGALSTVFAAHGRHSQFEPAVLSHYFLAMVSWRIMLARECGLHSAPTKAEVRAWVETMVDDFIKAFLRPAAEPPRKGPE